MSLAQRYFDLFLVLTAMAVARPAAACDAIPVEIDATFRVVPAAGLTRQTFTVDVPKAGMLSLDVSTPGESASGFHLESISSPCAGISPAGADFVSQSPRSWVLIVGEAGMLTFGLASDDPTQPLPPFKLQVALAPEPGAATEVLTPAGDAPDQCSSGIDERASWLDSASDHSRFNNAVDPWDCDILVGRRPGGGGVTLQSDGLPLHVTLWSGSHCGSATQSMAGVLAGAGERLAGLLYADQYEIAVDSWAGSAGTYTLAVRSYDLCTRRLADDYGDTFLCASGTKLGATVAGVLGNEYGDDADFATFVLENTTTVTLDLASEDSANLSLFNRQGQMLGEWTQTAGSDLTVAQSLSAGRYFVALTQRAAGEVEYELSLDTPSP